MKFSYCSKFHVNMITGYGVMTIFVYKRLTRNPDKSGKSGNGFRETPSEFCAMSGY